MIFVSVTRLRLRALRFLPGFAIYALQTLRQCKRMPGFQNGSLLADRRLTFWTMTLWDGEVAMRAYMTSGAHRKAMPMLLHWCDEASVVHWTQDDPALPDWPAADRRMRIEGRPSKVRNPSPDHAIMAFASPRTASAVPFRPASTSA